MVIVTASLAQDAVFFAGEKLTCQFRFSNPITQTLGDSNSPRITSPTFSSRMGQGRSSISDTNSNRSFFPEEGNSLQSSRSSLDSYHTASTASAKASRNGTFPAQISKAKSSELPSSQNRGGRSIPPRISVEEPASRGQTPYHQSSLSQPNMKTLLADDSKQPATRQYRTNTISSWFSKFSGGTPEAAGNNTGIPAIPPNNKEELLWGYVQLVGHFIVDENFVQSGSFESLKSKCMYRAATGLGNGGGTPGFMSSQYASNGGLNFSGLAELKRQENRRFPVFSSPPSVLFCDLTLNPGESKVFDYEITLPEGLPSSHRGKCVKILYYLIIGTQKGEITHEPNIVQLPFRLFSRVNASGLTPEYNLMEPVLIHKDTSVIRSPTDAPLREPSPSKPFPTADDFLNQALKTLSLSTPSEAEEQNESSLPYGNGTPSKSPVNNCLKAVYGITRKTKPVSFTFSKGDTVIGRLCLRRSFFRIGESIHILIHFLPSPIKCYQISVTLESYEQVVPEFACQSAARTDQLSRIILTQYHTLSTNADRLSFDLAVPNHCTPGFFTSAVSLQYRLRLEFLVAERTLHNVATAAIDRHHTHNKAQLPLGVEPEKLSCLAPISLLPTHPAYAKTHRSFHSFNMN